MEANLFEPNPVGKFYSMETDFIEYSIKKVAPTTTTYRVTYVDNDTVVRVTRLWHKFQNQNLGRKSADLDGARPGENIVEKRELLCHICR